MRPFQDPENPNPRPLFAPICTHTIGASSTPLVLCVPIDGLDGLIFLFPHARSGVLVLGPDNGVEGVPKTDNREYEENNVHTTGSSTYADESFVNDLELGCTLVPLSDPQSIRSVFPPEVRTGSFEGDELTPQRRTGYLNRDCGWADAGQGIRILLSQVEKMGALIRPGQPVARINQSEGKTTGVTCTDGAIYEAELVIIATGSWTPSTFPDLELQNKCRATGWVIESRIQCPL